MSSPQHPTGSGPQPWQDQPPQYPGQNQQQPGAQPGAYGSGPGPYGSAPGQNPSAPGPYGSAPGPYGAGPAQYGSAPGPYDSAPGQYGSGPGPYGSAPAPGPNGSAPGPYGSAPGQFGAAPAPKQKSGPGLIGPLTLRDLFLLFAGLLALIALFVPYRAYAWETSTLWHWNVADMGALVFAVLTILLIAAAVLVNKLGNGRMRVGSLGLDQFISVLSAIAFTYVFIDLLTSAVYWHVGSYLTFFAALIALFAGVFTMIPFFASEFSGREDIETHPKARPVSKRTPHPAPVANVPGGSAGAPGFAPYGSAPAGSAQPGPGQSGPGQPGQGDFAGPGQPGQPGQPGGPTQPGPELFAGPGQPDRGGGQGQPDSDQFAQNQNQFGAPEQQGRQPNPYAPPEQQGSERAANSFAAPAENLEESHADVDGGSTQVAGDQTVDTAAAADDSADGPVHSTGEGQTYLGRRDSEAPQHSQSEPTQAFGVGAGRDQADPRADQPQGDAGQQAADSSDSHSGAAAAAAGVGVVGAGAVAAGAAAENSDSERRRGRHAAPESDAGEPSAASADRTGEETATVVSPAESSDFVSKVNAKSSDTNSRASDGATIGSGDSDEQSAAGSSEQADAAERPADYSSADENPSSEVSGDNANIRSTEATVVNTPAGENVVGEESSDRTQSDAREDSSPVTGRQTEAPESEEPTQYVPVDSYRNRPETESRAAGGTETSDEDTVAQTAIDNEPVPADAGQARADSGSDDRQNDQSTQNNGQDGGRTIIQAFWFAVPEPREAVDPTTGLPVFTIYPGDWYLSLEDNGSWFKVRDSDGSEGILRNIEGIQRG